MCIVQDELGMKGNLHPYMTIVNPHEDDFSAFPIFKHSWDKAFLVITPPPFYNVFGKFVVTS